jgi:SAM-dependent methyltransferase
VPRRPERLAEVEGAIAEELEALRRAQRFCDWMFSQFSDHVRDSVAEVGAGIGTFSERILAGGAERLLLIEPEESCAKALERQFGSDARVALARETLPGAPTLRAGEFDLVVCQNVLEHVADDAGGIEAMAEGLAPGGRLALVVPAGERLFGPLDDAYGHWRRYEAEELRSLVAGAGLEVERVRHLNALGVAGWRAKNLYAGARIGAGALRAYEALVPVWRPLEERLRPRFGLSLVCLARRP